MSLPKYATRVRIESLDYGNGRRFWAFAPYEGVPATGHESRADAASIARNLFKNEGIKAKVGVKDLEMVWVSNPDNSDHPFNLCAVITLGDNRFVLDLATKTLIYQD